MEFGGLFGLLLLIADIFAIIKVFQSAVGDGEKVLWILLIALLPLIGLIIWYLAGPGDKAFRL
ncbi:MAG: PLDc N-terminal domain-containing protein [Sedimenticola sp.]|nr:PLDc N-terminal domain-containing protein [Sedimenticola sp.]